MSAWLGWTTITEDELRAAQRLFDQQGQGVRDELGLAPIHYLYSDRFFPGTSTQMTRLRYVFFVAGAYELLRQASDPEVLAIEMPQLERRIAVQLITQLEKLGEPLQRSGVIGHTVVGRRGQRGRPPKLLPSMSYWTALVNWKFLDRELGEPARSSIHDDWGLFARRARYRGEVDERQSFFSDPLEQSWANGIQGPLKNLGDEGQSLSFKLDDWEQTLLRTKLKRLTRDQSDRPALMARIVSEGASLKQLCDARWPWSKPIRDLARDDTEELNALLRSRQAAYLVQACRVAYNVLVARVCTKRDRSTKAREILDELEAELSEFRQPHSRALKEALELNAAEIAFDLPYGPKRENWARSSLARFLGQVQDWLRRSEDISALQTAFERREFAVKQNHFRMKLTDGCDLRRAWLGRQGAHAIASVPLDYRWPVVANRSPSLLRDL
jgi:hypothetical protein